MDSEANKPPEASQPTQAETQTTPQVSRKGFLVGMGATVAGLFGLNRLFNHLDQQAANSSAGQIPTTQPEATPPPEEKAKMDAIRTQIAATSTPQPLSTDKVQGR